MRHQRPPTTSPIAPLALPPRQAWRDAPGARRRRGTRPGNDQSDRRRPGQAGPHSTSPASIQSSASSSCPCSAPCSGQLPRSRPARTASITGTLTDERSERPSRTLVGPKGMVASVGRVLGGAEPGAAPGAEGTGPRTWGRLHTRAAVHQPLSGNAAGRPIKRHRTESPRKIPIGTTSGPTPGCVHATSYPRT